MRNILGFRFATQIFIGALAVSAINSFAQSPAQPTAPQARAGTAEEELRQRVAQLESTIEALRTPSSYVVVALFKIADIESSELAKLPAGQRSGLPTVRHRWCPEEPCGKYVGNTSWVKGLDPAGRVPESWKWTHVVSRTFASSYEAELWLAHSTEGKFITQNAEIVMTATVSDYSKL